MKTNGQGQFPIVLEKWNWYINFQYTEITVAVAYYLEAVLKYVYSVR